MGRHRIGPNGRDKNLHRGDDPPTKPLPALKAGIDALNAASKPFPPVRRKAKIAGLWPRKKK